MSGCQTCGFADIGKNIDAFTNCFSLFASDRDILFPDLYSMRIKGQRGAAAMAVSYKKLFKILIDRDMKKKEFREYVGISYSTLSKLEKGENTNVDVLERICLKMDCRIEDIMEILPDQPPSLQPAEQGES
jgi:DNA-binding Xre family transcriptional regulator